MYVVLRSSQTRVTRFFLLFFTRALLEGIKGGILFKLEMFSKRITICGGALRFEPLDTRDRIAEWILVVRVKHTYEMSRVFFTPLEI